jgi:hypothetical protein
MPTGSSPSVRPCRSRAVAALLGLLPIALAAAPAQAAPETVGVRIEGKTQTLFEGPVVTDGHRVKVDSDPVWRRCDGTNGNRRQPAGAVPTAAAYDAMRIAGLTVDGSWHEGFDDFFLKRLGPDDQDEAQYWYWGVLVNGVFTPVGGCQHRVTTGDAVLWAYNAFNDRPFLRLAVAGDDGVVPSATATVAAGAPLTVRVLGDKGQGAQGEPSRPVGDVPVAPVATAANGFQSQQLDGAPRTAPDGTVALSFAAPGWHRVKAGDFGQVRSNRLDVCVLAAPMTDCGPPPPDTLPRTPPPLPPDDSPRSGDVPPARRGGDGQPGTNDGPAPRIQLPSIVATGRERGRVGVRWKVLKAGVGVRSWTIDARTLRPRAAGPWRPRAHGTRATQAQLSLPAGVTSQLRITVVDRLGRGTMATIGRAVVPRDDRAAALRFGRGWRRGADAGAWRRTVTAGGAGARLSVRLPAGRPTVVLRSTRSAATVEIEAGGRRERFAVAGSRSAATRLVTGASRGRAGTVVVRVLSGRANLDGVAVQP